MRIYIAGKITGLDHREVFEVFDRAVNIVAMAGHEPLDPMQLVDQTPGREYNEYLLDALAVFFTANAIYMLPNWQDSYGARVEHAIAVERRIPIFYAATELRDNTKNTHV